MPKQKKIKFPYGRSNFAGLVKEGYYFVDKTPYLEWLDEADESYLSFFFDLADLVKVCLSP